MFSWVLLWILSSSPVFGIRISSSNPCANDLRGSGLEGGRCDATVVVLCLLACMHASSSEAQLEHMGPEITGV